MKFTEKEELSLQKKERELYTMYIVIVALYIFITGIENLLVQLIFGAVMLVSLNMFMNGSLTQFTKDFRIAYATNFISGFIGAGLTFAYIQPIIDTEFNSTLPIPITGLVVSIFSIVTFSYVAKIIYGNTKNRYTIGYLLEKLEDLKENGSLSDEEYEMERKNLIK